MARKKPKQAPSQDEIDAIWRTLGILQDAMRSIEASLNGAWQELTELKHGRPIETDAARLEKELKIE